MTEGSIYKKIISFSLPIFLGQLLSQLYNVVDSIVVGRFVGKEALASVSSSGSLIFLFTGFFTGLFIGGGVIIGKRLGAREYEGVSVAIHTSVLFSFAIGVMLTILGVLTSPLLLQWIDTPADVLPNSILYFRIYFYGSIGNMITLGCNGIFQSLGDSKRPLYFMIAGALLNIALDILFVAVFGFGIAGAAYATAISQFASAALYLTAMLRKSWQFHLEFKQLRIDWPTLWTILKIGFPTGIQNSVIAIANVIVQSNINQFESDAVAGCGSYFKLEGFAFLPITSFSMALTTFVSQNLGAGNYERTKKGARFGLLIGVLSTELIGILFFTFAPYAISLFNNDPNVVAFGTLQARTETLFYFLLAFSHCVAGILRGAGKTSVPMIVMLASWCLFRITYITIAVRLIPNIQTIFCAYPITWTLSSIAFLIYYHKADWIHTFVKNGIK